jgi:hypothetical protein
MNLRYFQPAEREATGQLFNRQVDADKFTQPG